jgi:sugar phosphate isomerase/epimerase
MQKSFRLGATSYVFAADLVENARRLAGAADDMELVLFETETHGSNFPNADTIARLREIAAASGMTYTVHLPQDVTLRHAAWRDQNLRAIERTRALSPFAYVMHLDGRALMQDASNENVARWQAHGERALTEIIAHVGDAAQVCVENVEAWAPAYFSDMVERLQTARCVDVGHLWLNQCDPLPELTSHLSRTRVIHLHGVAERDHASLAYMPDAQVQAVLHFLLQENYAGVLTLEVFGESDFFTSRTKVERILEQLA